MGEQATDERETTEGLTPEEQAIIDGDETPETGEAAETEGETPDAEGEGPDGGEAPEADNRDNVQRRIDELTAKSKTAAEKLELLKTDPDRFYQLYPDEKPQGREPAERKPAETPAETEDPRGLLVEGGPFDGWSFGDVFARYPQAAWAISPEHAKSLADRQAEENERNRYVEEARKELEAFASERAKEIGADGGYDALDNVGKAKVDSIVAEVTTWMEKTGRGGGIIADAYALMTMEGRLKAAKAEGASKLVDDIQRGRVETISSSTADGGATGYERDLQLTSDQLADRLGRMSDGELSRWMKDAPEALRKKHPGLPW